MALLTQLPTPQQRSSACVYLHLPQRWKYKQNSILYEGSLQYTVSNVNLAVQEVARRQRNRRTNNIIEIRTDNECSCVIWRRYQWIRVCIVGDRRMNTETDERICLKYWWQYGDKRKPNRTQAVTSDQSEAFFIIVQRNTFLVEELLQPRPTPILEDQLCLLSETSYSKHLQLPPAQEFVVTSATWGRAMPWRRLIAQGKAEGIGERCLTATLSTMNLTMDWYWQSRSAGRKMSQYYFFHHKSHMSRPEIAIERALWEPGDLPSKPSYGLV
jgi:hypothetical protein